MMRLLSKKRRREEVYLVVILSEYEEASRRFSEFKPVPNPNLRDGAQENIWISN
jgi:hypothetical protein